MATDRIPRQCPFVDCRRPLRSDNESGLCGKCQARTRTLRDAVRINAKVTGRAVAGPVVAAAVTDEARTFSMADIAAASRRVVLRAALPHSSLPLFQPVAGCEDCPLRDHLMERCRHPEAMATSRGYGRDIVRLAGEVRPGWCGLSVIGPLLLGAPREAA